MSMHTSLAANAVADSILIPVGVESFPIRITQNQSIRDYFPIDHDPTVASKYPPAEPVALRLLGPSKGPDASGESKSKNKSKNLVLLSSLPQNRQCEGEHTPGILKVLLPPQVSGPMSRATIWGIPPST